MGVRVRASYTPVRVGVPTNAVRITMPHAMTTTLSARRCMTSSAAPYTPPPSTSPSSSVDAVLERGLRLSARHLLQYRLTVSSCPNIAELSLSSAVSTSQGSGFPISSANAALNTNETTPLQNMELEEKFVWRDRLLGSAADRESVAARTNGMRRKRYSCARDGIDRPPPPPPGGFKGATRPGEAARPSSLLFFSLDSCRHPWLPPPEAREEQYEPYTALLHQSVERECTNPHRLVYHPEAPSPAEAVLQVMEFAFPTVELVVCALRAASRGYHGAVPCGGNTVRPALQRLQRMLRSYCPTIYEDDEVRGLLLKSLVVENLFDEVTLMLGEADERTAIVSPDVYELLLTAAAKGKLPDSNVLWKLLHTPRHNAGAEAGEIEKVSEEGKEEGDLSGCEEVHNGPGPKEGEDIETCKNAGYLVRVNDGADLDTRQSEMNRNNTHSNRNSSSKNNNNHNSSALWRFSVEHSPEARDRHLYGTHLLYTSVQHIALTLACLHRTHVPKEEEAAGGGAPPCRGVAATTTPDRSNNNNNDNNGSSVAVPIETKHDEDAMIAVAVRLRSRGVMYGVSSATATQLLLRAGVGFGGLATPLLGDHIVERYAITCATLQSEMERLEAKARSEIESIHKHHHLLCAERWSRGRHHLTKNTALVVTSPSSSLFLGNAAGISLSIAAAPHPSPYFVLLRILREARDVVFRDKQAPLTPLLNENDQEVDEEEQKHLSGQNMMEEKEPRASEEGRVEDADSTTTTATPPSSTVLSVMHWNVAWSRFQQLNNRNRWWLGERYYTIASPSGSVLSTEEAEEAARDVLEVLCRGADPWMALNVARRLSAQHVMDGLEAALWLLHRLDPSHHPVEARAVTRRVFQWLLEDVGVHLNPQLQVHLIPAARVLIRLNLMEELHSLYNVVLDHNYAFSVEYRLEFMSVMEDLVCPRCSALLCVEGEHSHLSQREQVYLQRRCVNCVTLVPPKSPDALPSFVLTAEHIAHIRSKRKMRSEQSKRRLHERAKDMYKSAPGGDAAVLLRRRLFHSPEREVHHHGGGESDALAPVLIPGVPVPFTNALFGCRKVREGDEGPEGDGIGIADAEHRAVMLDLQSAMEESQRRLERHRAARALTLSSRGVADSASTSEHHGMMVLAATPPPLSYASFSLTDSSSPHDSNRMALAKGPWVCVWCYAEHAEHGDSRVQCCSCGAETGPDAPWRRFVHSSDVMLEIRARLGRACTQLADAVVSAYLLMVYRRTFLLRCTPQDTNLVMELVRSLIAHQERVLAGYVFTRFVPPQDRLHENRQLVLMLAALFHTPSGTDEPAEKIATTAGTYAGYAEEILKLRREEMCDNGLLYPLLFTPQTCTLCFGQHSREVCPMQTRQFGPRGSNNNSNNQGSGGGEEVQTTPLRAKVEEKLETAFATLKRFIDAAEAAVHQMMKHYDTNEIIKASSAAPHSIRISPVAATAVASAYTYFISSPFRQVFAEKEMRAANVLSTLLSRLRQYRRAAFVLCHIPLRGRWNNSYQMLLRYYQVDEEEALRLLSNRGPIAGQPNSQDSATSTGSHSCGSFMRIMGSSGEEVREGHPNFMQVTQACCMCLDERHASFACPRLQQWGRDLMRLREREEAAKLRQELNAGGDTSLELRHNSLAETRRRLLAQVAGWTAAGPERLHSFYRFLLDILTVQGGKWLHRGKEHQGGYVDVTDPLVVAINKTVEMLLDSAQRRGIVSEEEEIGGGSCHVQDQHSSVAIADAKNLYVHTPPLLLLSSTTLSLLRVAGYEEETARKLMMEREEEHSGATASVAVPLAQHCLLCFHPVSDSAASSSSRRDAAQAPHALFDCSLWSEALPLADRIRRICNSVGSIATDYPQGPATAAALIHLLYNEGKLRPAWFRQEVEVAALVVQLAQRCFRARHVASGLRLVRYLPLEMIEPEVILPKFWQAANLSEDEVEERTLALLSLYDAEGLKPSMTRPPPRQQCSPSFLPQWHQLVYDGLCRHCLASDHLLPQCTLFHEEINFGRDLVAAYRMSMISDELEREWQEAYLGRLADFARTHRLFLPFHIAGVSNALNAIVAMWCFRGEPGIAAQLLLWIPPAYRRRQSFRHVLHALHIPSAEITNALSRLTFSVSSSPSSSSSDHAVNQHPLLDVRVALRDEARQAVFQKFPAAIQALEEAPERLKAVAARSGSVMAPLLGRASLQTQQVGGIAALREDFDPILSALENALGMRLGSRHALFSSAVDLLEANNNINNDNGGSVKQDESDIQVEKEEVKSGSTQGGSTSTTSTTIEVESACDGAGNASASPRTRAEVNIPAPIGVVDRRDFTPQRERRYQQSPPFAKPKGERGRAGAREAQDTKSLIAPSLPYSKASSSVDSAREHATKKTYHKRLFSKEESGMNRKRDHYTHSNNSSNSNNNSNSSSNHSSGYRGGRGGNPFRNTPRHRYTGRGRGGGGNY